VVIPIQHGVASDTDSTDLHNDLESTSLAQLIQKCVVRWRDGPWNELFEVIKPVICGVSQGSEVPNVEDFEAWFRSWLATSTKLLSLLNKMRKSAKPWSNRRVKGYLRKIVRSAITEYRREQHHPRECADIGGDLRTLEARTGDPAEEVAHAESTRVQFRRVEDEFSRLPIRGRIVVRLRHWPAMGDLTAKEIGNIGARRQVSADQIRREIKEAVELSKADGMELTFRMIGTLVGAPPGRAGRYNSVEQCHCRAICRLGSAFQHSTAAD